MKCELCGSSRRDSIKYGEFLTKKGKGVHTNCLYLSSGIIQNGKDEEGILGFLPKDIAAEKKRVSTVRCCYCGEVMANIGCCERRCRLNFHMICGIENGAMNQFVNSFRSFCHRHVRKVNYRPKKDDECCICFEKIFNESTRFSAVNMIRAPCCRNGWFHKYCLQQFAKNAGYFFKCPLCNDSTDFKRNMSLSGIFVQNKDAEWEMVPNAYAELLERPSVCAAEPCHNTKGRGQAQNSNNPFIYCVTCGSVAMHLHCTPQRSHTFECDNCKSILHANSGLEAMETHRHFIVATDGDDADKSEDNNSDIDVCGSISEDEVDNVIIQRAYIENENSTHIIKLDDGLNYSDDTTIECQMQLAYLCSADERLVDVVEEQENVIIMQDADEHKVLDVNATIVDAAINSAENQDSEENYALNISCVAQRTRRKYVTTYIPACEDQIDEDNKSTASYKSSECCQVFEYDDGNDVANDNTKNHVCSTEQTNEKIKNPLDISCIANRTRRRSMKKIEVKSEEKNICEDNDTYEYISLSSHNSYQPSQSSTFFKSECYENENGQQIGNGDNHGNSLMTYFYQLLNEVKSNPQTKHTQTENSNVENVDEIEVKSDPLNTSCIAKRTRRRLSSVNLIDTIKEKGEEAQDAESTTNSVTSSQDSDKSSLYFGSTTEHQTAANTETHCPDTDTASKVKRTHSRKRSRDSVIENANVDAQTNTICKNRALTPNGIRPASSNVLTSPAFTRAHRRYLPSRRFIESADMYKTHKSLLGRSPVTKYENWSNIKESSEAYFTPNFMRVNGKLKSALKESAQQQQNPRQIAAAQTHFSRSYQLLLECNENHYASTSANAQRV
uniref:G2/M phase-specific E3 ubiquitin-protein ligase n=1 Tax=Bactrocera latifrons TaxID=174628 RepID=A0A0K8URD7_BACLA